MTTLREAAQQELTYDEFCSAPLTYLLGINADWGAQRMYRNDDLGIQMEVITKRRRRGDIYSGWKEGEASYFMDKDPREFANTAELYEAWMSRVCGGRVTEPVQEPVQFEPQEAVTEDGWCEWVCPRPRGYLMQCCDCGLIHEVESRVAKYQARPSEEFEVVDDPDLQVQFRMKRRDDISPKQAPQRPAEPVQEPVAWGMMLDGQIYDCICPEEHARCEGEYTIPLYTVPPQRKPLTEGEIRNAISTFKAAENLCGVNHIHVARAIERAHGIGGNDAVSIP